MIKFKLNGKEIIAKSKDRKQFGKQQKEIMLIYLTFAMLTKLGMILINCRACVVQINDERTLAASCIKKAC